MALLATVQGLGLLSGVELAPGKLRNPINPGPGPFMVGHRVDYYLTTTQWDAIRIWKATTLAGLKTASYVTVWQDADPSRSQGMWAPDCHLIGNRWYRWYTATSSDNHYQPRDIAGFRALGAMPCRPGGLGNVLGGAGAANAVPP